MDVAELKKKRDKLTADIFKLVDDFQKETLTSVKEIDVRQDQHYKEQPTLKGIEVKIELGV